MIMCCDGYNKRRQEKLLELLNQEHGGFAITFEVICTLTMMTTMIFLVIFLMMTMNAQRFMHTVLTTTAAEASRWGGYNTYAYHLNVNGRTDYSGENLVQTANKMLISVVPQFNPVLTCDTPKISHNGQKITVEIRYSIWDAFKSIGTVNSPSLNSGWRTLDLGTASGSGGSLGGEMHMKIGVYSTMKAGSLL